MADKEKAPKSYLSQVIRFYLAPDIRSAGTLAYLGIFGYFMLYYVDSVALAIRFLFYVLFGHTALSGTSYLMASMAFVLFLVLPFLMSVYAIFVLHKVWDRPTWAAHIKWLLTLVLLVGGIVIIMVSDAGARWAAKQPSMQSFVEDANLTGRI